MKKLKNNDNKIISVVINNNQYDLFDGVASFQAEDVAIAKTLGFKEFEEVIAEAIPEIIEEIEAPSPAPVKKTKTKKSN